MTALQLAKSRPDVTQIGAAIMMPHTSAVGQVSAQLTDILSALSAARSFDSSDARFLGQRSASGAKEFRRISPLLDSLVTSEKSEAPTTKNIQEQLYDALASFKVRTATIAMHLDRDWRDRLFAQLDSLLAADDWQIEDETPTLASFSTFIRMLMYLRPQRRPGLGATGNGHLIASWTLGDDKLTMECLPSDFVRWNLSVFIEGERERVAAESPIQRLAAVLAPYNPSRWFNADHVS